MGSHSLRMPRSENGSYELVLVELESFLVVLLAIYILASDLTHIHTFMLVYVFSVKDRLSIAQSHIRPLVKCYNVQKT